jgi:DNA polymerase-3 subunit delta'
MQQRVTTKKRRLPSKDEYALSSSHLESVDLPKASKERLQRLIERHSIAHLWVFVSPTAQMATEAARAFLLDWLGAPPHSDCHPDLLELHPSGKVGLHSVAAVRQMLEQLSLAPLGSAGRAVLIDAADRMAPHTSNALLKALEEPPPSTTIILATAAPHLLLPTIISRSQVVRLPGKESESFLDLSSLLELLKAPTGASYSELLHACESIQKDLEREEVRFAKELNEKEEGGSDDLSAATKQELALEAEGGLALWTQNVSKQALETVYLAMRKKDVADPASLSQKLLQAMNGIDRGADLSTMLLWMVTQASRSAPSL